MGSASSATPPLMYDVGLHHGHDTAYYLSQGWTVIGIDANPLAVEHCRARFADAISQGRLKLHNVGIMDKRDVLTFYVNHTNPAWSSFMSKSGTLGGSYHTVTVQCMSLAEIVEEHGRAFGMKIDIEGADLLALASLTPETAPDYISVEAGFVEGSVLERLNELGYSGYKLVNQSTFTSHPPIFEYEWGWRAVRLSARVPLIAAAIRRLPRWLRPKADFDAVPVREPSSSGPFGESAYGSWVRYEQASAKFNALRNAYERAGTLDTMWWDVHARHRRLD